MQIYSHLEYLLSKNERYHLRETVVGRVKNSAAFLATASAVTYQGSRVDAEPFLQLLDETIPRLPILGYLYFEALAEYLMLHSTSPHTQRLAELGELNNWLYKEMLFAVFPSMAGKFDLARFRPCPKQLAALIHQVDPSPPASSRPAMPPKHGTTRAGSSTRWPPSSAPYWAT